MTASTISHSTVQHDEAMLSTLRRALLETLDVQRAQLVEAVDTVNQLAGALDSDSLLEREIAERAASRVPSVIADVEHALARIDDGTYGSCERCGDPIASARLEAIPHARCCVTCAPSAPGFIS